MRIRQVRPEFFTDPVTGHLPPAVQVTYIGLWCIADDAGWLVWDVPQIGALLYPYKSVRVRERAIENAGEALVAARRLVIRDCGCAHIPTLMDHQRIGGNKSFTSRDEHQKHRVHTGPDLSAVTVSDGNNVTVVADAPERGARDFREKLVAAGLKPAIVGGK